MEIVCERCCNKDIRYVNLSVVHGKKRYSAYKLPLYAFNMILCKQCREEFKERMRNLHRRFMSDGE
jgi:hypothetical protein